jgi:hypothetical protein
MDMQYRTDAEALKQTVAVKRLAASVPINLSSSGKVEGCTRKLEVPM